MLPQVKTGRGREHPAQLVVGQEGPHLVEQDARALLLLCRRELGELLQPVLLDHGVGHGGRQLLAKDRIMEEPGHIPQAQTRPGRQDPQHRPHGVLHPAHAPQFTEVLAEHTDQLAHQHARI
ncbi:MAG: hypothetical protein FJ014_19330 [Chloroflexi bacterium]|nr:hypothetical protein [Chloroflexota bacterium]